MLFGRQASRVLVYENPVDMRKSFDGLLSVASQGISEDVLSGSLFLFVNRSKTILKVLFWDRTGWCVVAKRLERGRFEVSKTFLNYRELELLFDGICRRK
ncbi:MAG: IS66 family insertion sequence element accessory protein TnpB [Pseudomonadota bacterium]|jgi:transposase